MIVSGDGDLKDLGSSTDRLIVRLKGGAPALTKSASDRRGMVVVGLYATPSVMAGISGAKLLGSATPRAR